MGAKVEWIADTNTVDIKYELGELEDNSGVAEMCGAYGIMLKDNYDTYKAYRNNTLETIKGEIVLTNEKVIKFELFPQFAPETAARFAGFAKAGIYNGTIFHRVIKDFVAQGGGFTKDGSVAALTPVKGEFAMNGVFNFLPHERGTLSLARANDYNSGTSQFFICHQDCAHLDGSYAAFGRVTEGIEVVDEICNAETDESDRPKEDIIIKEIKIID
jgi:peptidyl-prolyl cis-trans isomerase B (cyclophilin B)